MIIINDDQSAQDINFPEEDIMDMLDSGFVSAVLRIYDGKIQYYSYDWETGKEGWEYPKGSD